MSLPLGARGWVPGIPAGLSRRPASFGNAWLPPRGSEASLQPQPGLATTGRSQQDSGQRPLQAQLWSPGLRLAALRKLSSWTPLTRTPLRTSLLTASAPFEALLILPTNLKTMFLSRATAGLWSPDGKSLNKLKKTKPRNPNYWV